MNKREVAQFRSVMVLQPIPDSLLGLCERLQKPWVELLPSEAVMYEALKNVSRDDMHGAVATFFECQIKHLALLIGCSEDDAAKFAAEAVIQQASALKGG